MNSNGSYSPETPNLGQNRRFLKSCDLEIWWMTLKNYRALLLSTIKLYATFYHHIWIQTGVTVRKRLSWVMTSAKIKACWKKVQKTGTDGRTDRWTDGHRHGIIRLFFKRAYKKEQPYLVSFQEPLLYSEPVSGISIPLSMTRDNKPQTITTQDRGPVCHKILHITEYMGDVITNPCNRYMWFLSI